MRLWLVLFALAGCDRVFGLHGGNLAPDGPSDAPPCMANDPDDEDCDGLPNASDPCPADTDNADPDGDGLGEACDPSVAERDQLVMFDGFNADHQLWAPRDPSSWQFAGGQLANSLASAQLNLTIPTITKPYGELYVASIAATAADGALEIGGLTGGTESTLTACQLDLGTPRMLHLKVPLLPAKMVPFDGDGPMRLVLFQDTNGEIVCRGQLDGQAAVELRDGVTSQTFGMIDTLRIETVDAMVVLDSVTAVALAP